MQAEILYYFPVVIVPVLCLSRNRSQQVCSGHDTPVQLMSITHFIIQQPTQVAVLKTP